MRKLFDYLANRLFIHDVMKQEVADQMHYKNWKELSKNKFSLVIGEKILKNKIDAKWEEIKQTV
jgi:hypothetical protein